MLSGDDYRRPEVWVTIFLSIHMDGQIDGKTSIGSYVCTEKPGEFRWQPGSLTQAVLNGFWVVFEDIDKAPSDVQSILLPLLEGASSFFTGHGEAVSWEIRKILTQRAASFNIALDDVSITGLTFGKEFTAAIEAKQIAAEEAERAKFVVEKASRTREGEAASAQLIGKAISKNQSFLTLRKIEVARDIAQTISKSANRLFLNSDELLLNHQGMNECLNLKIQTRHQKMKSNCNLHRLN
ncbi:hypothetical protein LOK49_LG10G01311 [Camellia lanceoleosa]|uniref:Uncharacterized protein n=1 Tax=Camellia lanceoleosa TaxID=1840588 RepID=A0ACC0GBU1_9ERIC|nr:hypothetical protein LOK49_LG10G01311 [Camellia lanceoleosa]